MIPKIIHYCWFGRSEKPQKLLDCMASWEKHLEDYEIREWNEDNFDISLNTYAKEAYKAGKYAFVTDYVRLYALYHYGGIYMDTDVEVLRPLDKFLNYRAFTGCESEDLCVTGIMAAEKGHEWIKILLDDYKNKKFILENGSFNLKPNTYTITQLTADHFGWQKKDEHQELRAGLNIYPFITFCAKNLETGKVVATDETYTIHHFAGSWLSPYLRMRSKVKHLIGPGPTRRLKKIKKKLDALRGKETGYP